MIKNTLPILVLAFNRPDLLKELLGVLKSNNCTNVYVSIDGPRDSNENDTRLVSECVQIARCYVDENRLNVSALNRGCKLGVVAGIEWFFGIESAGLILEDDIRFNSQFLEFIATSLEKYEYILEVGSISGFTPLEPGNQIPNGSDSYFHPYFSSWGWATWKSRWDFYELNPSDWKAILAEKKMLPAERNFWAGKFDLVFKNQIDTWDYQFIYASFKYDWKTLVPKENLISNVGFREDATHTKNLREFRVSNKSYLNFGSSSWPTSTSINEKIASRVLNAQYGVKLDLFSRIKFSLKAFLRRFM